MTADITLASASPRRHELLAQLGVDFTVLDADIDESWLPDEAPAAYAERLAREKARAGWRLSGGKRPVMGADTIVVLDGDILLKPVSAEDAAVMWRRLSGRTHQVISAVALALDARRIDSRVNRTAVSFGTVPEAWLQQYSRTREPMDKAGAYAVQGRAARWIRHIEGSFSGVMGLPLFETAELLANADLLDRAN